MNSHSESTWVSPPTDIKKEKNKLSMFLKIEKIFKNIHTSDKKTKNGEHSTKCREMKQIKNIPVCEENVRCKSCTFQPK